MKKLVVYFCMMAAILSMFAGCVKVGEEGSEDGNSSECNVAEQIKQDYAEQNDYDADELSLFIYGEYNGTYALIIDGPWGYAGVEVGTVAIGGVEFYFPSPRIPQAYNAGTFYSLEEAYDKQLLLYDDLADLRIKFTADDFEKF